MSERHIHVCDCDECLNGGSGVALPGAGQVVSTEPGRIPAWRVSKLTGDGSVLLDAERARQRVRKAVA